MPDNTKIVVKKLEAAKRQLDCAIDLWFRDADEVSIHTLAAAAYQIVHDINRHRGGQDTLLFDSDRIVDEYRTEWMSAVKQPVNFFKHANRDPEGSIEFAPFGNITFICFAIRGMNVLKEPISDRMNAFMDWLLFHQPELIVKAYREKFYELIPFEDVAFIMRLSKMDFLENQLGACANRRRRATIKIPEF